VSRPPESEREQPDDMQDDMTDYIPHRNALWIRVEDGLLVQVVTKHSTSDVRVSECNIS
jgi:hypothetical protein